VGDTIHVVGHLTDFTETVGSMQIEHEQKEVVRKGDLVGIKVAGHAAPATTCTGWWPTSSISPPGGAGRGLGGGKRRDQPSVRAPFAPRLPATGGSLSRASGRGRG